MALVSSSAFINSILIASLAISFSSSVGPSAVISQGISNIITNMINCSDMVSLLNGGFFFDLQFALLG